MAVLMAVAGSFIMSRLFRGGENLYKRQNQKRIDGFYIIGVKLSVEVQRMRKKFRICAPFFIGYLKSVLNFELPNFKASCYHG